MLSSISSTHLPSQWRKAYHGKLTVESLHKEELKDRTLRYAASLRRVPPASLNEESHAFRVLMVRFLLAEGSNLSQMSLGMPSQQKYVLARRTLNLISDLYPGLHGAVQSQILGYYSPRKRTPVCIPSSLDSVEDELEAEHGEFTREMLLEAVLHQQTDYDLLISRATSTAEKGMIRGDCLVAVSFAHPYLYDVARDEAEALFDRFEEQAA